MYDLSNLLMCGVLGIESLARQDVNLGHVIVFDALVEDFGADEAGCAGYEDFHVVGRCVCTVVRVQDAA